MSNFSSYIPRRRSVKRSLSCFVPSSTRELLPAHLQPYFDEVKRDLAAYVGTGTDDRRGSDVLEIGSAEGNVTERKKRRRMQISERKKGEFSP